MPSVPRLQTVSWKEGVRGLISASFTKSSAASAHPCYVAMTVVKDWPTIAAALQPAQAAAALAIYRRALQLDLKEFSGWILVSQDLPNDDSLCVCAFHEVADAAAWAMRTHHALLNNAFWPDFLQELPCCKTIYRRQLERWERLFAGLRPSTAINRQMLLSTTRAVRARAPTPVPRARKTAPTLLGAAVCPLTLCPRTCPLSERSCSHTAGSGCLSACCRRWRSTVRCCCPRHAQSPSPRYSNQIPLL